jgi:hypothetical protein
VGDIGWPSGSGGVWPRFVCARGAAHITPIDPIRQLRCHEQKQNDDSRADDDANRANSAMDSCKQHSVSAKNYALPSWLKQAQDGANTPQEREEYEQEKHCPNQQGHLLQS